MTNSLFHILRNTLDYPLRQLFHWRRDGLKLVNEEKNEIFRDVEEEYRSALIKKEIAYRQNYDWHKFYSRSKVRIYRINLYYLELLETAARKTDLSLPTDLIAADIGCSQWFYVQALYSFYSRWSCDTKRKVQLHGYEADAYRVLPDFHSRYDYAMAFSQGLAGTIYYPDAFITRPKMYHMVSMFFPFIFVKDHLEWGLPKRMYQPAKLLQCAWESIAPGGKLLIVNQGDAEHEMQHTLLYDAGIQEIASFKFHSDFYHYPYTHFVIVAGKEE